MKKIFQKLFFCFCQKRASSYFLVVGLFILLLCLSFSFVFAEEVNPLENLVQVANRAGFPRERNLSLLIGRIVRLFLSFAGLILLIIIIYGGFLWMTSGGEEEKIKKAKGLIQSAVIGLAIVIFSYALAYFVIKALWDISMGDNGGSGPNPP